MQIDPFDAWLAERPKWLQTAAADLLATKKKPTLEQLNGLATLCEQEVAGTKDAVFKVATAGELGMPPPGTDLRIERIDSIFGLNAIRDDASLDLQGKDLVTIYGSNGAGKTGFSRLLKRACGARTSSALVENVFESKKTGASAIFRVFISGESQAMTWSESQGSLRELQSVHVFDALTAASYVNQKNEASYEPRRMRFISALVAICDAVADSLNQRKLLLPCSLPTVPVEFAGTAAWSFIKSLDPKTSHTSIDQACKWIESDAEAAQRIDVLLKQSDVEGRIKEIDQSANMLSILETELSLQSNGLSADTLTQLRSARDQASLKRSLASKEAATTFSEALFDGTGQAVWAEMWERARAFSNLSAYAGDSFPVVGEGSKCVLCQQSLSQEAQARLISFEKFVLSQLRKAAETAEDHYRKLLAALPPLPNSNKWAGELGQIGIEAPEAQALLAQIVRRRNFMAGDSPTEATPPDLGPLLELISSKQLALSEERLALETLNDPAKRADLRKQLIELRARQWASQQREAINLEIARLGKISQLDKALKLAATNSLTSKKNELANVEIANGIQSRFVAELDALGGKRIPVAPQAIPEGKGKVSFRLTLVGAKHPAEPHSILSDGEMRIVALASFLADITGSPSSSPFVFDDPISSLDQDYEERVVARLLSLSKSRQVIVFTHRLSLLSLLEEAISKESSIAKQHGQSPPDNHFISLTKWGNRAGYVDSLDVRNAKPDKGFKFIRDHTVAKMKKAFESGDFDTYQALMKSTCSDFRILIERTVEKTLLNGVVERFRRTVQTQQIASLLKISASDSAYIDKLMTKYSGFVHSQADELPVALPDLDDFHADVSAVVAWIDEFSKR